MTIDFNAHYKVKDWPSVAVCPIEYKEDPREEWVFIGDPEKDDYDDDANWDFQVDWIKDETQVYVIMVGDDTRHLVDVDDLELIKETDFCRECGQIGCGHLVYE